MACGSFLWLVLNQKSDLVGNEEVVESRQLFINAMKAILSRRTVDRWALPACLVPMQTFSVGIMYFVGNM